MKHQSDILNSILDKARQHTQSGGVFKAIFDLDSTLFDVQPRLLQILTEFSQDAAMRLAYPDACRRLGTLPSFDHCYNFKEVMMAIGMTDQTPEFYKTIFRYWGDRFFSGDYVKYDLPYDGAVEYVQEVYDAGATVIYLTGRDVHRMGRGTEESLAQWKFPLGSHAHIALKPHKDMDDAIFKRDYLMTLPRENVEVWFFENEPVNIDLVLREVNHVNVVYFDSVHMNQVEPPGLHIPRIKSFSRPKPSS